MQLMGLGGCEGCAVGGTQFIWIAALFFSLTSIYQLCCFLHTLARRHIISGSDLLRTDNSAHCWPDGCAVLLFDSQ